MSKKLLSSIIFIGAFLLLTIASVTAQSDDYIVHTVKHGEVPSVLAKKYNVALDALASLNHWGPKVILHVGDKIKLPAGAHVSSTVDATDAATDNTPKDEVSGKTASVKSTAAMPSLPVKDTINVFIHTVEHGETPSGIAKKFNVSLQALTSLNKWAPKTILHVGDKIKLPAAAVASASTEQLSGRSAPSPPALPAPAILLKDTNHVTVHIIQHGEIPSVLAKKYNINVDDLKKLNNWKPSTVWHVGDKIKLPPGAYLTDAVNNTAIAAPTPVVPKTTAPVNDTTAKVSTADATLTGIEGTYVVQKRETLYGIAKKYKVSVANIKSWNHLTDDHLAEGQRLLLYTSEPIVQPSTEVKVDSAVTNKPTAASQPSVIAPQVATQAAPNLPITAADTAKANPEGYFSSLFGLNVAGRTIQSIDGVGMTFKTYKTASGTTDGKYYILMNDVSPGSIVKVTNADGKSIYAKVLWNMGDAKDNEGLTFRLSDAAATTLGLKEPKFQISVTCYK